MTSTNTTPSIQTSEISASSETFVVESSIELPERLAGSLFVYADLFEAARRRLLHILFWVVLLLVVLIGFSSWQDSGDQGFGAFASRFGGKLFGLDGLVILLVVVPTLAYYAIQPMIFRRRLTRWCRDEQLDRPMAATYRFEPGGITAYTPGHCSAIACQRIIGLTEGDTHFFIRLKDIEDVLVLRRSALSDEQIARIKAWAASCQAGGAGEALDFHGLADQTGSQPLMMVRFEQTAADRAIALGWQMERPSMRRRRRRGFALTFLLTALIWPAILVVFWLLDADRVPVRYAFPLFLEMLASSVWQYVLGFWAIIVAIIVLHPWARGRHAHRLAEQLHKRMRVYEQEVRLYEDRLDIWQEGLLNRFEMISFERIERRSEHFLLLQRVGEPVIVPLRAFDDDKQAAFERVVARRIDEENHRLEAGV
ncbi:YcxB-like protein domain-containing protein [Bordetella tumbae]|uniref:YcxB family protein n=1 Tax=Bordetella tumbae TaxID=1649139 RepID=UPI0039EF6B10